jgi:glutamyl-tRNA(Gln) amidotransferase subunit D
MISSLSDYDGVVLMGTGLGHVPTNPFDDKTAKPIIKEIRELIGSGVSVVMAPQPIYGRLNFNIYTAGRLLKEAGVVGDGIDWNPETAYVKLCWVLGHEKNPKKVAAEMATNLVGEISERSEIDTIY